MNGDKKVGDGGPSGVRQLKGRLVGQSEETKGLEDDLQKTTTDELKEEEDQEEEEAKRQHHSHKHSNCTKVDRHTNLFPLAD